MPHAWIKAALSAAVAFACCNAANAGVIGTDSHYGIAYAGQTVFRSLDITTHGTISDLNLTVEFAKCGIDQAGKPACNGDVDADVRGMKIGLMDPTYRRQVAVLVPNSYTSGYGRVTVKFDDEAQHAVGGAVASGTFRPSEALSGFDGMDMFGKWYLYVADFNAGPNALEYFSSRLEINGDAAAVPEPATLGIVGIGLAGLIAARRRSRKPLA